jgi:hypothetical protein
VDIDFACRGCGQASNFYGDSLCAGCFLPRRVIDLLTGPDGTVPPALQPLAQILISARRPDSVLRWLDRYPAAVLPGLAAHEPPITHDAIDALPNAQRLGYLRQLLVQSGVLPARCEPLERITPWLEDLLKDQPQHRQLLIRPYASWAVLRAARRAALRGRYRPSRAERDRAKICTALRLLEWLDTHQTRLEHLTQAGLETWLHQHPTLAEPTNSFITWTARHRLTTELTVPRAPQPDASTFLDTSDHLEQLRRCRHDGELPLNVRVAAALVLLYGLPVTRIRALTLDQITHRRGRASLTTGRTPIPLPAWLTELIDQLATQTPHAALSPDERTARLLFPGRPPSRPVTANSLTRRLNRHGFTATPARNTALLALAADLPASVLADAIGIHRNTATRWARLGNSDWATYLAAPGRS